MVSSLDTTIGHQLAEILQIPTLLTRLGTYRQNNGITNTKLFTCLKNCYRHYKVTDHGNDLGQIME